MSKNYYRDWFARIDNIKTNRHKYLFIARTTKESAEKKVISELPNNDWGLEYVAPLTMYELSGLKKTEPKQYQKLVERMK